MLSTKKELYLCKNQELIQLIQELSKGIYNGSLTIVKQDNVAIQINIHEEILRNKDTTMIV